MTAAPGSVPKWFVDKSSSGAREITPLNPHCVACGPENPYGLRVNFRSTKDRVFASWAPNENWASFSGTIHGGIVSTILDEAMSKAVIARGYEALTAELKVRFRARVMPGDQLHVVGWIVDKRRGLVTTEALLMSKNGQEQAHAWGKFLIHRREDTKTKEATDLQE